MKLDYFDLFLVHWPIALKPTSNLTPAKTFADATVADRGIATHADGKAVIDWAHACESIAAANGQRGSIKPTWRELQRLVGTGKIRAVGVSNFNIEQLQEVFEAGGDVPLSCNQIEAHPWLTNTELIEYMRKHEIVATIYSPFGGERSNEYMNDSRIQEMASKNGMGAGQLLQSWAVQRGTIPLGKSQNPGVIPFTSA